MKIDSLKLRVFLASTAVLFACMFFMGIAVVESFEDAQYKSIEKKLASYAKLLRIAATFENHKLVMPRKLPDEHRFDLSFNGMIIDANTGELLWRSDDAASGHKLSLFPVCKSRRGYFDLIAVGNKDYLVYDIKLQTRDGQRVRDLCFMTFDSADDFYTLRESFNHSLLLWQLLTVLGALVMLYLAMRWILTPMNQLATSLNNLESGKQTALENDYPIEISRLTQAVNKLLAHENNQRERYKNAMADLAHSLKTPLSVIHSIQDTMRFRDGSFNAEEINQIEQAIDEQVNRMNQIVNYQLQRAVTRQQALVKKNVPTRQVTERISNYLGKVYRDKEVCFYMELDDPLCFLGEEQDMMEVLGNLLENAFRLCLFQVRVTGQLISNGSEGCSGILELTIEDDGPGIPADKREQVLQRGVRADSRTPGQGIGLAVAIDIIDSYSGQLAIDESELGGARFILRLPGRKAN